MSFTRAACTPSDGLKNTSSFPQTPANETAARKQVQDVIDQSIAAINTLETELEATGGAANIGCTGAHSNIQDFITATEAAGSGTSPGAGVVTNSMLNAANKTGLLADLLTTAKSTFCAAINEVFALPTALVGALADLTTTAKTNVVAAINEIVALMESDIGKIEYWGMSTPPTKRLAADGSAVSRVTYAKLFAKIGTTHGAGDGVNTFNLPDHRGVVARGWDNGRGLDAARVFGSYQADDNKAHTHTGTTGTESATHTHSFTSYTGSTTGPDQVGNEGGSLSYATTRTTGTESATHNHSFTTASTGSTEVTVKNIALFVTIRYA